MQRETRVTEWGDIVCPKNHRSVSLREKSVKVDSPPPHPNLPLPVLVVQSSGLKPWSLASRLSERGTRHTDVNCIIKGRQESKDGTRGS